MDFFAQHGTKVNAPPTVDSPPFCWSPLPGRPLSILDLIPSQTTERHWQVLRSDQVQGQPCSVTWGCGPATHNTPHALCGTSLPDSLRFPQKSCPKPFMLPEDQRAFFYPPWTDKCSRRRHDDVLQVLCTSPLKESLLGPGVSARRAALTPGSTAEPAAPHACLLPLGRSL